MGLTESEEAELLRLLEIEAAERGYNIDWQKLLQDVNQVYVPLLSDWKRFNVLYGGAGSGKSVFESQRSIYRVLTEPGYNLLIIRKFATTNRFSTFALVIQTITTWGLSEYFKVNKSDMTITCTANNNQILFLGLDDREKLKSITFLSGPLTAVWIEEASEISQEDLQQVDLRLRGQARVQFQITVSFNPVSAHHWLKAYFFDADWNDATITRLRTTYKDNRFLDDGYKARLEGLSGNYHKVYALGEWGQVEGLVFQNIGEAVIPENAKLRGYGLDFGFATDPCALIGVYERGEEVYFDEVVYKTGLTNSDLSAAMKSEGVGRNDRIVADSAEPKSIEELHRLGWNIHPAKKGPDSIRFGIDNMMAKKLFVTPRSKNLLREFYSYEWRKDKDGKILPEPVDCWNHGIDAARYFVMDMARGVVRAADPVARGRLGI